MIQTNIIKTEGVFTLFVQSRQTMSLRPSESDQANNVQRIRCQPGDWMTGSISYLDLQSFFAIRRCSCSCLSLLTTISVTPVRDLKVHLDSDISMDSHLSRLVSSCFDVLRQTSLPSSSLTTLMAAFILSKLDYCNVVLAGLPTRDVDQPQSVSSAAARLTTDMTTLRRYWKTCTGCVYLSELHTSRAFSSTTVCTVQRHATYKKSFSLSLKSLHDIDCGHHLHLSCWCHNNWWPSVCRRCSGPRAWNNLPGFITDCSSSRTIKQYLKT